MTRTSFAAAVVLLGCGSAQVSLDGGGASGDYDAVLDAWTREVGVTGEGFENALTGSATYRSWQFREAWVNRFAADHQLPPARKDELAQSERAAHEAAHEFLFSGYAGDRRSLDLGTDQSAWRVALVTDSGSHAEPSGFEEIRRPSSSTRAYYPYVTTNRMTYVIRFPRDVAGRPVLPPGTKWFALRFDGPRGHAEMKWEIE